MADLMNIVADLINSCACRKRKADGSALDSALKRPRVERQTREKVHLVLNDKKRLMKAGRTHEEDRQRQELRNHQDAELREHKPEEYATIFGYGSLMDEASATATTPSLRNFRYGVLSSYTRSYSLVSLVSVPGLDEKAKNNGNIACLSIEKCDDDDAAEVHGCLYEIPISEIGDWESREERYRVEEVLVRDMKSGNNSREQYVRALTVVTADDNYLRTHVYPGDRYMNRVWKPLQAALRGTKFSGKGLWGQTDVLPLVRYANNVESSAALLHSDALENYLDQTLLADGKTTMRQYKRMLEAKRLRKDE